MEPPAIVAELKITLNAAGQVVATGCIDNIMMVHGLCELAKDIARERSQAQKKQIVEADGLTTLQFGRRG